MATRRPAERSSSRAAGRARFPLEVPDLERPRLKAELRRFLREDRAAWDLTSRAVLPSGLAARGTVVVQADGVVSGLSVARALCRSAGLTARPLVAAGAPVRRGQPVLEVRGEAARLLAVERTLLNLLMHVGGVATATARAVRAARQATGGRGFVVAATRKTLPGLRDLEKAAVVDGGGDPHRRDLSSAVLIKSNHLALVSLSTALARAHRLRPRVPVIVEVASLPQALEAARGGADRLLLDNLAPDQVRKVVRGLELGGLRDRVVVEVSGGITERNVAAYARAGADVASLGSITHSAPALPMHLVVRPSR